MWAQSINSNQLLLESPAIPDPISNARSETSRVAPPIAMLGVVFDNVTLAQAVHRIEQMIWSQQPHYVVTANVDFLVQSRRDAQLRRVLNEANLVVCDGTPLVWASRVLGNALPERVAGADLVPELIRVAAERKYRIFFLGATDESNAQAVANVRANFPQIEIAGAYSPPFRPLEQMDNEDIARRIREAKPDMLFVAFGCPKAERWIAANYRALGVPVVIGVGGTIDFLAGRVKRAPLWMQRGGVEWLFRLCQEPRRLFKRYATDLWHFGGLMLGQCWRLKWRETVARVGANRVGGPTLKPRPTNSPNTPAWHRLRAGKRLDANSIQQDFDAWETLRTTTGHCVLDCSAVRAIDSTGVAVLARLEQQFRSAGRRLVLRSPSSCVQRALRAMRCFDCFEVSAPAIEKRSLVQAIRHVLSVPERQTILQNAA